MKVYVIYDTVAEEAGPLMPLKNDKLAVRMFHYSLQQQKVENPKDFQLMCLGEYDPEQPALFGIKVPDMINTKLEDDDE